MRSERFGYMGLRLTVTRGAAALTMLVGLAAVTLAGSQAHATATTSTTATTAACTKYVVISPQPVEIWLDSEPNPFNETWFKLSLGQVFCASGSNASNTRFKVDYYCHPAIPCDPVGPHEGWVTNSPLRVIQLNCADRTLTRLATVFTVPEGDEAWMDWPSGTSFCTYGTNATGTRYQVFVYCGAPPCARDEGVYVGWLTSDPSYYAATPPSPPSNLSAAAPVATSIRLQWTDNSFDEDGFEIMNGAATRRVGGNTTAYTWDVAPGTYMCFKIRAYNAFGYSSYSPSAQTDWVCTTTPQP